MEINKQTIPIAVPTPLRLSVGQLPSGDPIYIESWIYDSGVKGTTGLLLGGLHGDEINGVEIVRRGITSDLFSQITRGRIIAIPVLNIYGFLNFSRDVPDGKDVNRSFPGSSTGSLAYRVANTLTKKVLPLIDWGLDFHTGGSMIYNYPQVRYTANHPASKSLAQVFQAPFNLISKPPQKSLRHLSTTKFDVPMLVYEGGESLRFDEFSIQTALEGIQRIFAHFGMLEYVKPANSTFYNKSTWIRASHAGLFATIKKAGQQVAASEIIGWINDPQGTTQYPVKSTKDGVLIAHNNKPVIHQGDALFHIAY